MSPGIGLGYKTYRSRATFLIWKFAFLTWVESRRVEISSRATIGVTGVWMDVNGLLRVCFSYVLEEQQPVNMTPLPHAYQLPPSGHEGLNEG